MRGIRSATVLVGLAAVYLLPVFVDKFAFSTRTEGVSTLDSRSVYGIDTR